MSDTACLTSVRPRFDSVDAPDARAKQERASRHAWQIESYRKLGYVERHQQEILELAHVDPHDLERLLKHGCSRELAMEILT